MSRVMRNKKRKLRERTTAKKKNARYI